MNADAYQHGRRITTTGHITVRKLTDQERTQLEQREKKRLPFGFRAGEQQLTVPYGQFPPGY